MKLITSDKYEKEFNLIIIEFGKISENRNVNFWSQIVIHFKFSQKLEIKVKGSL